MNMIQRMTQRKEAIIRDSKMIRQITMNNGNVPQWVRSDTVAKMEKDWWRIHRVILMEKHGMEKI